MLKFIKSFFGGKPTEPTTPEAPYKVEAPVAEAAPAKCGCGRSQSGLCVGLHKLTPEEWATHSDNPAKPAAKAPKKAKAPAKSKVEKKPAAIKAPKKPRAKKEAK